MGQPEEPARPEDKKEIKFCTGQIWGSLIIREPMGQAANFYWADLVFLIIREPMGQPEGPASPEDKRTIKFLLGRFGVP